LGYVLFAESQWARQIRSSSVWRGPLWALESWVKGFERQNDPSLQEDSLVIIGEIRGENALLVRDFSSLVFRFARENEVLKGRNVLLTKNGVYARLWLVDYDSWLEMQPNTLIVVDRTPSGTGHASALNLSVLAGSWQLKKVSDSDLESLKTPQLLESVKSRREMRRMASQDRNPSSLSNKELRLPGIQIQDFVKMKEYESLNAGELSEGKEIVALAQRPPELLGESKAVSSGEALGDPGGSLWGTSASIEGAGLGDSLNSELRALAKILETSNMASLSSNEASAPVAEDAQRVKVSDTEAPLRHILKGSLKELDRVWLAETYYISSVLKAREARRAPAASAVALSLALERASSYGSAQELSPALSQVLTDYLNLYLAKGECGIANELYENVQKNFALSPTRREWERKWAEDVKASQCQSLLQGQKR
jgi:hypothetical protein